MNPTGIMQGVFLVVLTVAVCGNSAGAQPRREHGLHYTSPATVWDEALPLGNGLLGALVWGDGKPLRISLDRTDLWDLRPVPEFHTPEYSYRTMRQWVKEGRIKDLHRLYDEPYGHPGPTKIPAGRIELTFEDETKFESASLDIGKAVAAVHLNDGVTARVFVHATEPLGLVEIKARKPARITLIAPPFAGKITEEAGANKISAGDLATLRYEAPIQESGATWTGYLQKGWGDFRFAVALVWRESGQGWLGVWSICTSKESNEPLATARKRCEAALARGLDELLPAHEQWWAS